MKTYLFVSLCITVIFSGLKLFGLIDWMWIGIIAPILLGLILIGGNWLINYFTQMELDSRIKHNLKR